jgi:plasmid stabilization system protein ParE
MPVRFLADAKSEFADQEAWYEKRQEGLGAEFYAAIKATVAEVAAHPSRFPKHGTGVRGCLAKRFPFAVIYDSRPKEVVIVAIMHTSRLPEYWRSRVTKK